MSATIAIIKDSKERMIDPRTTKVLGTLLIAMTVGALLLMAMESEPPRPSSSALASIRSSEVANLGVVSNQWRRIVVHSSLGGDDTLPSRCHFVISDKPDSSGNLVHPTARWEQQLRGHHTYVNGYNFNSDSIGICVMGDFSNRSPSQEQFETILAVIRTLQQKCGISAKNIYLNSELKSEGNGRPGRAFPVGEFNSRLGR